MRRPFFVVALVAGILSGAVVGYIFAWYSELPDIKMLQEFKPLVVTKIYSDDGQVIGELFQEKRELLEYAQIPPAAINAVLATEDTRFFEHRGVRVLSILRAILADIRAGKFVQGGSTITQQLAKTLFLSPEKTLGRKLKEMLIALQLEINYTKKEILTLYFNQIYFGQGAYGLQAAAKGYFGKSAEELTLAECALMGGLPRAPEYYSPHKSPERARVRRSVVLKRMLEEGYITAGERKAAEEEPIELKAGKGVTVAPYFLEAVRLELQERYGDRIYREGLNVHTTLNVKMQKAATDALLKGLAAVESRVAKSRGKEEEAEPLPVQGALIAIDPATGGIKAMVGGRDFSESMFNRATQAWRQPGSAFKPIIYAAAVENGVTAADILIDSPVIMKDPSIPGDWKPMNFSGKFYGPVTARVALEKSLNLATIKLLQRVGVEKAIDLARRLGIKGELRPYPSLALGGFEVTLKDLTAAYATFANHGMGVNPVMIRRVENADGEILEDNPPEFTEVMGEQEAFVVTKLLEGVVESGTGQTAKKLGRPAAAKTGTTDSFTDALFVGYTAELATGVWVGYDIKKSLGRNETGGRVAAPVWTEFMAKALEGEPVRDFRMPDRIVEMDVDAATGLLPSSSCGESVREYFVAGTEPARSCVEEGR